MRVAFPPRRGLVGPMLHGKRYWVRVSFVVLLIAVCGALPLVAETSTEDVHIQPRVQTPGPKEFEIAPAFKTHTKPFKVEVDLVLVPVTIPDPLTRLVTALDRE